MNIAEKQKEMDEKIDVIFNHLKDEEVKRVKKKEFKLPFGLKAKVKRGVKKGKLLCVYLRSNKTIEFKIVNIVGGLVELGDYRFNAYESDAVYSYKNLPVIVALEWRLLNVGGSMESWTTKYKLIGTEEDKKAAIAAGVTSYGQQTMIRGFELIKVEKENPKKKKGGLNPVIIIIGIIVVGYLIGSMLGLI